MVSPGVILTCQYTLPNSKSFTDYINYITRKEALEKKDRLTQEEKVELAVIDSNLKEMNIEVGEKYNSTHFKQKRGETLKESEMEAEYLMNHYREGFDEPNNSFNDFKKYIDYMSRSYALETKNQLSRSEVIEKGILKKSINEFEKEHYSENSSGKVNETERLTGTFSMNKDRLQQKDMREIKNKFQSAKNNGSIFYQDVISHDNLYLQKLGLYDPKTNILDEEGIIEASKSMMDKLLEKEQMKDTGFWVASIHRNTKHIHVHFAIVEERNTRKTIQNRKGEFEPKGKRRMATLDAMKPEYANSLERYAREKGKVQSLNRYKLNIEKSDLRNDLVQKVKDKSLYGSLELKLLNEIYQSLPEERKDWNYGEKNKTKLSETTRKKLDELTSVLLNGSEKYQRYFKVTQELAKENKDIYGESKRTEKDSEANANFDLKKRLGNSVLSELKKYDKKVLQAAGMLKDNKIDSEIFSNLNSEKDARASPVFFSYGKKEEAFKNYEKQKLEFEKQLQKKRLRFKRVVITKQSLNSINRVVAAREEKYQNMKVYEEQQRRIQMEQER